MMAEEVESGLHPIPDSTRASRTIWLDALLHACADSGDPRCMECTLRDLYDLAAAEGALSLVVDVRPVAELRAPLVRSLVRWLQVLESDTEEPKLALRFLIDARVPWQNQVVPALCELAAGRAHCEPR